jgi:hypothetical protein
VFIHVLHAPHIASQQPFVVYQEVVVRIQAAAISEDVPRCWPAAKTDDDRHNADVCKRRLLGMTEKRLV